MKKVVPKRCLKIVIWNWFRIWTSIRLKLISKCGTSYYFININKSNKTIIILHGGKFKKEWDLSYRDSDLKSCQIIASDKSNLLRKSCLSSEKWFPSYNIFYSFGGMMPSYNCCKLCLQMSMTFTFGTSQNNVLLVYIFGIFFPLVTWFHYGHVAFTIFQSKIPKWLLSNSKALNTCEDKIMPVLK